MTTTMQFTMGGNHPFENLTPYLGIGETPPEGWRAITAFPLLILVGGSGVGKSVAIQQLTQRWHPEALYMLPNRRELTDRLVVAPLQRADGAEVKALGRMEKLAYIRRFRQLHPPGLAYPFAHLWVDGRLLDGRGLLVFDGLRGEEEVRFAAAALPQARFAAFDAPVFVRLCRLINRNDAYDSVSGFPARPASKTVQITDGGPLNSDGTNHRDPQNSTSLCERLGVPEACGMFSPAEEEALHGLLASGEVAEKDLRDRLKVLAGEYGLYDVEAAIRILNDLAPDRTVTIDTVTHNPQQVGERLFAFINLALTVQNTVTVQITVGANHRSRLIIGPNPTEQGAHMSDLVRRTVEAGHMVIWEEVARDGAQAETLLSGEQRVKIARATGEIFGAHGPDHVVFAAGYPSICKEEFEAVRQVVAEVDNVQLATHGRVTQGDIDLGIQALQGARYGRVTYAIPSSDRHAGWFMHVPKEEALQRGVEMARYAVDKANGLAVDVALGSAPRVEPGFLAEMVVRLSEEGISICKICDSTGELFPLEATRLFQGVMAALPPELRGRVVVGAHLHNDFGFGLANNLEAARLGVRVLSTSWLGLGERAGLAPTEQVIFALSQMGDSSDPLQAEAAQEVPGRAARLGIAGPIWFSEPDLTRLVPVARMVAEFTGVQIRGTEPVVGTHMNHVATGAYFNNPVAFKPFDPQVLLGVPPKLLLSHLANHSIVEAVAASLGYTLTREQCAQALAWVKTTAYNQGRSLVSHDAFLEYLAVQATAKEM